MSVAHNGRSLNLPNRLTLVRLFLSIGLFVIFAVLYHLPELHRTFLFCLAAGIFIAGALTDTLDGYIARKYKIETRFGRILDPLADKVFVCGSFIMLIPLSDLVPPWLVLIIITREMGVTALRGLVEASGKVFGASPSGKAKMWTQSITVPSILLYEAFSTSLGQQWLYPLYILLAITVLSTVVSGLIYLKSASSKLS